MEHIGKTKEQKKREAIREFYAANAIRRKLQKDLLIGDPYKHNYYNRDSILLREMEGWLRRLSTAYERDKEFLGLSTYEDEPSATARGHFAFLRGRGTRKYAQKIMTLKQTEEAARQSLHGNETIYVPKYWDKMVLDKSIQSAHGSCMIKRTNGSEDKYYGYVRTLNAREVKADWINDQNMKAYKVVVCPEIDSNEIDCPVTGYIVRSTLSEDLPNSFGVDIHKAVSLCKRRTKKAVLEQMGV